MGPIDDFFARNGMPSKPKKKSFYDKVKPIIPVTLTLLLVIAALVAFVYVFQIPIFISK
jgi:hypothetical protein